MAGKRVSRVHGQISAARRVSLLKFGLEAERKKRFGQAVESYRCLIEEYPESEEGKRARTRLRELAGSV